jgi:hypothetical protein
MDDLDGFNNIYLIKRFLSSIERTPTSVMKSSGCFEYYIPPFTYRIFTPGVKITDAAYVDVLVLDRNDNTVYIFNDPLFLACEAIQELSQTYSNKGLRSVSFSPSPYYPTTMTLNTLCEIIKYVDKIKHLMVFA